MKDVTLQVLRKIICLIKKERFIGINSIYKQICPFHISRDRIDKSISFLLFAGSIERIYYLESKCRVYRIKK